MKKKFVFLLSIFIIIFCISGCKETIEEPIDLDAKIDFSEEEVQSSFDSQVWEGISGSFARENSNQYNNALLQMKYLGNNCVMFEFRLMEGSESEDYAIDTVFPGILLVDNNGIGKFETDSEGEKNFIVNFKISKDGQQVIVDFEGDMNISPNGVYDFVDNGLEVSETSAISILEHLPSMATSLNKINGDYTIHYPEELVADWFYTVEVTYDVNGKILAKFVIAKDLSAVFRVDDDIEPILIFGYLQPMLDAQTYRVKINEDMEELDEEHGEQIYEPIPILYLAMNNGSYMTVGDEDYIIAMLPWSSIPCTYIAKSEDPTIASVDEDGKVTAIAVGEVRINVTISAEDAVKEFPISILVGDPSDDDNVENVD